MILFAKYLDKVSKYLMPKFPYDFTKQGKNHPSDITVSIARLLSFILFSLQSCAFPFFFFSILIRPLDESESEALSFTALASKMEASLMCKSVPKALLQTEYTLD